MKRLRHLMEKRRNPELNPQIDSYEALQKYRGDNNIFITYTEINKVGINPSNDFNTPTAIYCYPLNQMWKLLDKRKNTRDVPFAGNRTNIQVLKHNGQGIFIHDLHTKYSKAMFDKDMAYLRKAYGSSDQTPKQRWEKSYDDQTKKVAAQLLELFVQVRKINEPDSPFRKDMSDKGLKKVRRWMNDIQGKLLYVPPIDDEDTKGEWEFIIESIFQLDEILEFWDRDFREWTDPLEDLAQEQREIIRKYNDSGAGGVENSIEWGGKLARIQSYGGQFWNITRWVANKHENPESGMSNSAVARWNKVLRDLGYAGMADRSGKGIIHPGEPTQAIFLSTKGIKRIELVQNKQVKKTYVVKNMNDIRGALNIEFENRNDFNRLMQLVLIKKNIKNFKDIRKIINNWIVKDTKTVLGAVHGNDLSPIFSWIAHENLLPKIKMDLRKRMAAYLYLVNPTNPFPYYRHFGIKNADREDMKIITNIAKFYGLGEPPKKKRFSTLTTWCLDRMEKQDKMSKKEWDKEVLSQLPS